MGLLSYIYIYISYIYIYMYINRIKPPIFVAKTRNYDIFVAKIIITRLSVAFEDLLGSSITPQAVPHCLRGIFYSIHCSARLKTDFESSHQHVDNLIKMLFHPSNPIEGPAFTILYFLSEIKMSLAFKLHFLILPIREYSQPPSSCNSNMFEMRHELQLGKS